MRSTFVRSILALAALPALAAAPAIAIQLNIGDLLVVDEPTGTVRPSRILRFNPSTGAHDVISSGGLLSSIQHITLDRDGRILVADSFAGLIRIDPANGAQTVLSGDFFDEGYQFPRDVLELLSGDLLVTTTNRHILRIDGTTGAKTVLTQASAVVESMAWHGEHILITSPSFTTPALLRFDPATWMHTVVSSGGFFSGPRDLVLTQSGYAYIADTGGILVGVDPVTGMQTSASAGYWFKVNQYRRPEAR